MSNKSDRTLRGSEVRHQAGSTSCSDVLHQLAGQTSNFFRRTERNQPKCGPSAAQFGFCLPHGESAGGYLHNEAGRADKRR